MVWGGESQRVSLNRFLGYSVYARFTGTPAYLEPIWSLIVVLCRNYRGGLSALAVFTTNSMLKNRDEPIWSLIEIHCRNYRGGLSSEHTSTANPTKNRPQSRKTSNGTQTNPQPQTAKTAQSHINFQIRNPLS
jgi:hypothetical protein